jgi:hypothetical protein
MSKPRDAAKERYWRNLIRRQESSGLGTRRFCDQVGVPEHRFHWWRRTLRWRDHHDDPGVHETDTARATSAGSEDDCSAFVPVRLPFSLGASIEVVHPRGYVIRVPSVFDASALQRILATLDSSSTS